MNKVTGYLSALKKDDFVAVNIEGYHKVPALGKVNWNTGGDVEDRVETTENCQTEMPGQAFCPIGSLRV